MIRAAFFDWFGTLVHYEPPREQVLHQVLLELGFESSPDDLRRALVISDRAWYEENAGALALAATPEERSQRFLRHQARVLREAGLDVSESTLPDVLSRMRQASRQLTFALFDDVPDTLAALKRRQLSIGVLTNMRDDVSQMLRQLRIAQHVDFAVTSGEAGAEKPEAPMFRLALQRAGVRPEEAVHIGDQYAVDVIGARGVGISAILLDRAEMYPDMTDCARIMSLAELAPHLS